MNYFPKQVLSLLPLK